MYNLIMLLTGRGHYVVSDLPSVISAGKTVKWRDEATTVPLIKCNSTDWTLTYYLRTNTAGEDI